MPTPTAGGDPSSLPRLPDERFGTIDQAVRSPETRVLSVDVFDTLLLRQVPKPTDAFVLLGHQLSERGLLVPTVDARIFAQLRALAETAAREEHERSSGGPEVHLEEIYAAIDPAIFKGAGIDVLVDWETRLERRITMPDLRLVSYLRSIVGEVGVSIVVVSDTYFSGDQVRALLDHPGLAEIDIERVFTSSDAGTGKGGGLWPLVVEAMRVEAGAVVHIGDNPDADVTFALRSGVRAFHYPVRTPRFETIDIRERIVGHAGDATRYCDERDGDGGLTALRRRATFAPAGSSLVDDDRVAWETGATVLGPVLAGFGRWVRTRADELAATRVVCLMREGRFLQSVIEATPPIPDQHLRISTAWVSREACARASIFEASEDVLRSLLDRLHPPSPIELAETLGLGPGAVGDLAELERAHRDTGGDASAPGVLVDRVLADERLASLVVARSRERRSLLLAHLRQAAGNGDGPVVVVDVGWSGTIQESLQQMLAAEDDDLSLHGLYLLTHRGAAGRVRRGTVLESYLGDAGSIPFELGAITGNPELIELMCMCDEGSLLEIRGDGTPVLAVTGDNPVQRAQRDLVQAGALDFVREWGHYRLHHVQSYETTPAGVALLRQVMSRFLAQPNLDEARVFSTWHHEENFGSGGVERLVPDRLRRSLAYQSADSLHAMPMRDLYWPGGAAGLVDYEMSDSTRLLREGLVDPGRFSGPYPGECLRLELSTGPGGPVVGHRVEDIGVNRLGRVVMQWRGPVGDARRLRIAPARRPVLLRLDLLRVSVVGPGGDRRSIFGWETGEAADKLDVEGGRWLMPGVLITDEDTWLSLTFGEPPGVGEIEVLVLGAALAAPGPWPAGRPADSTLQRLRRGVRATGRH